MVTAEVLPLNARESHHHLIIFLFELHEVSWFVAVGTVLIRHLFRFIFVGLSLFFLHFLLLWLLVKVLLGVEHRQFVLVLFISLVKVVQDII